MKPFQSTIFVAILQLIGLYLFKQGFLLSRLELASKSPPLPTHSPPRFNRTLLVLIDALRYDFMKWQDVDPVPHYLNKMQVFRNTVRDKPRQALLMRGLSDPPTTTMQRLMAIMTGTLPTLVDAGSNFASSALTEDNLLQKVSLP